MKAIRKMMGLALAVMMVLGTFSAAFAEGVQADAQTIVVKGSGTIYQTPEKAQINLGVQETASTVVDAQSTVNEKIDAVTKALEGAGIAREDISVGYLSIYASYDYNAYPSTIVGYSAQHQLNVKVDDIARAGEVIDVALKAGANQLDGINFMLNDGSSAYNQALELAIQNAAQKAEVAAAAYGKKLGAMVVMEEGDGYSSWENGISARGETAGAAEDAAPTEIYAGDMSVSSTVSVTYELID